MFVAGKKKKKQSNFAGFIIKHDKQTEASCEYFGKLTFVQYALM